MSLVETLHRQHLERRLRFMQSALNYAQRKARPPEPPKPRISAEVRAAKLVRTESDEVSWYIEVCGTDTPLKGAENIMLGRPISVLDVQREVCRHSGLSREDLLSHRRTKDVVGPRQLCMYLCKTLTMRSLPEIGRRFDDRDHTTVLHAVRKVNRMRHDDIELQASIDMITQRLGGMLE